MSLFTETVVIRGRTVTGEDDYGNDVYGWVERTAAAWWEPRTSGEQTDAREQVTSGYWLYLDEGTALNASAQVKLGGVGDWYEVDGEPGRQPGGFVVDGYVRVALKEVAG